MPTMDLCAATDSSQPVYPLVEKYYHPVYQRHTIKWCLSQTDGARGLYWTKKLQKHYKVQGKRQIYS